MDDVVRFDTRGIHPWPAARSFEKLRFCVDGQRIRLGKTETRFRVRFSGNTIIVNFAQYYIVFESFLWQCYPSHWHCWELFNPSNSSCFNYYTTHFHAFKKFESAIWFSTIVATWNDFLSSLCFLNYVVKKVLENPLFVSHFRKFRET